MLGVSFLLALFSAFGAGYCAGLNESICSPLPADHVCNTILTSTSSQLYYNFTQDIPGIAIHVDDHVVNIALLLINNFNPPAPCQDAWNRFLCLLVALPCDPETARPYRVCNDSCAAWELLNIREECSKTMLRAVELTEDNMFEFTSFKVVVDLYSTFDCRNTSTFVFSETEFAEGNCSQLLADNITTAILSTDLQCLPVPIGACTFVGIDSQSNYIPYPDRDAETTFTLTTIADRDNDIFCSEALLFTACGFLYPPCNPQRRTQIPLCNETCDLLYLLQDRCETQLQAVVDADVNGTFGNFLRDFSCSDGSYLIPGVPIDTECTSLNRFGPLLRTEEATQATSTPSLSSGAYVGIGIALIVILAALLLTAIAIGVGAGRKTGRWNTNKEDATRPRISSTNDYALRSLVDRQTAPASPLPDSQPSVVLSESDQKQYNMLFAAVLIPYARLKLGETIGEGAFGRIFKGELSSSAECSEVAVKTIKYLTSQEQLKEFFSESLIMKDFEHPNVLGLMGVCLDTPDGFPCIILPFMAQGNLRNYLKGKRVHVTNVDTLPKELPVELLIHMCVDVANGMRYLANRMFVHRDLAARNCMVDFDLAIRVGDFGLARDIYTANYYRADKNARLPVKWMPPETLHDGISNEKTDMWSFGVTCWEVFSLGRSPYPGVDNTEIVQHIANGGRLGKPTLCPPRMFEIIQKCWELKPEDRPSFKEMVETLQEYWDEEHFYIVRSLSAV